MRGGPKLADLLKLRESYMANFMFPKRSAMPREVDMRPIPDDYRPRRLRIHAITEVDGSEADGETYYPDETAEDETGEQDYSEGTTEISSQVNLQKLEYELSRNPLDEIATMMRSLTYGEMMELAEAIWKIRPEGASVSQDSLPMLLHRWSTSLEQ